jgi:hypothetical protein
MAVGSSAESAGTPDARRSIECQWTPRAPRPGDVGDRSDEKKG